MLKTSGRAFSHLPAGTLGPTAEACGRQGMDTCLNQPKGPVPANYQLTPSLKLNGIFLAPNLLVGRAPGRGLILARERLFPERELGLLCHLRSPNAASPPILPPGLPSSLLPSLLLSSPISLPSSLHPSLGWSVFSQRIVCNLCACVSVRVYLQCMYKRVCACPYCEHSSVPVHAQYPHVCLDIHTYTPCVPRP